MSCGKIYFLIALIKEANAAQIIMISLLYTASQKSLKVIDIFSIVTIGGGGNTVLNCIICEVLPLVDKMNGQHNMWIRTAPPNKIEIILSLMRSSRTRPCSK